MQITILGSGVIGVTSAYYLAKLGMKSLSLTARKALHWKPASPMLDRFRRAMHRHGQHPAFH
ncbi:hypothetical protein AB664_00775 [Brucella anthropi]|uniref:FAD dependent oxidoreductase domain-containing protein n=1 Tax=Brucella anthropi TaxID=529 RepID=A0A656Z4D5_BRUAN|nr:hypothetical protein AB664_00775 [Brucella anthropi]